MGKHFYYLQIISRNSIKTKFIILFYILLHHSLLYAYKENNNLIIIQKISNTKKTFIIEKGRKDKIIEGQKSLFSTENISVAAQAISSNRLYSQWKLLEENINIPFKTGQVVNMASSMEKIWTEVARLQNYSKVFNTQNEKIKRGKKNLSKIKYQLMTSFSKGISESISGSQNNNGKRSGNYIHFSISKLLSFNFAVEAGFRYDTETLALQTPIIKETTYRHLLTLGLRIELTKILNIKYFPYLLFSGAFGRSQTTINNNIKTGPLFIFPSIKFGLNIKLTQEKSIVLEVGFESLSIKESFKNTSPQKTNINNFLISLGIRI